MQIAVIEEKKVLDACCGSRMFWFDRQDARAVFVDKRRERHTLPDVSSKGGSRELVIDPDYQMAWDKPLWGVEMTGGRMEKPILLGLAWHDHTIQPRYAGEPVRALLFCTREQARAWCRAKMQQYAGRGDVCEGWKFRPVRVDANVRQRFRRKHGQP